MPFRSCARVCLFFFNKCGHFKLKIIAYWYVYNGYSSNNYPSEHKSFSRLEMGIIGQHYAFHHQSYSFRTRSLCCRHVTVPPAGNGTWLGVGYCADNGHISAFTDGLFLSDFACNASSFLRSYNSDINKTFTEYRIKEIMRCISALFLHRLVENV